MPREDSDLNPMTVGTKVLFDQGSDRVNGCFTRSESGGQHCHGADGRPA